MPAQADILGPHRSWLDQFSARHGRPPRVLHIGNIANNGYLNSKILNRAGIDSDSLSFDYYHIMGCPEWEEADYTGDIQDQFFPAWDAVDLGAFRRPEWFVQGPLSLCAKYLLARRDGQAAAARHWRYGLERHRAGYSACVRLDRKQPPPGRWTGWNDRLRHWLVCRRWPVVSFGDPGEAFTRRVDQLCQAFAEAFPERPDVLCPADFVNFGYTFALWRELTRRYDVVIGYALDGIYPLLTGHRPYFSFEHGTIRHIPFEDNPTGRVCALTYKMADCTFVTNCDNVVAAQRLNLARYRFLPHPVNEDLAASQDAAALRRELCARLNCDFLLFHPPRQHWEARRHPSWEKGNDFLIEGFARFVKEVCPRAGAVFVEWGNTVQQSRELLAARGIADRVLWVPPLPNPRMISYLRASDVLADQFFLGSFGSTMPKALLHRCPAMLYVDEAKHRWCFPEMPPVINARTPLQVFEGLIRLYREPGYAQDLAARGRDWYDRYHSNAVIRETLVDSIRQALARNSVRCAA